MIGIRFSPKFNTKHIERSIDRLFRDLKDQTFNTARSLTPVRSGYARSQWKKKDTRDGFQVSNTVEYMPFLDAGSSKQAPRGISKPTVRKVAGTLKNRRITR